MLTWMKWKLRWFYCITFFFLYFQNNPQVLVCDNKIHWIFPLLVLGHSCQWESWLKYLKPYIDFNFPARQGILTCNCSRLGDKNALFSVTKNGINSNVKTMDEWWKCGIIHIWYYQSLKIKVILWFAAACMNFDAVIWSKVRQSQKDTYYMLLFICGIFLSSKVESREQHGGSQAFIRKAEIGGRWELGTFWAKNI